MSKVRPSPFYGEWAGHPMPDLETVHRHIRIKRPDKPIIWLAGDSSLDNKAWVPSAGPGGEPLPVDVPAIYNAYLNPAVPKPDVAFWLNHHLADSATALNTAVEASLLRSRDEDLLAHDKFIRDNIYKDDILIVSVGANDIALSPSASTMRHMAQLAWLTPRSSIDNGTAWSLPHFKHMFKDHTEAYVSRIIEKQKPRAVIVCMIYFPLQADTGAQPGWAESQLKLLGYNHDPGQLQAAIKKIYEQATANVELTGTTVIPCALFEVMNGQTKDDYTARVEPSVEGGKKMASLLHDKILMLAL
ncbi:hypothetical protein LTR78_001730 [Recurvomyces mirabilis]|uniref:Uncharacterized protein n=1 Tax=Recurvomyces mirabilis TaxID=574656 RepID=A0AAE0WV66_9PEZI|nr:hypothetical protein LTR78_001730 [Recurvomyces mirabilis]KAK5150195.1 hypothetical protein LTS14_010324 [Recurvomyces mirabilis]